jgi:hypothetical protein
MSSDFTNLYHPSVSMPTVVITPPKHPKRSSSIVSAPARRAAIAADSPAGPEPTTRTCNIRQDCCVSLRRLCVCVCVYVCVCVLCVCDEQRLQQTALQGQSQPQEPALRSRQKARLSSEPAKIDEERCVLCVRQAASPPVWPRATSTDGSYMRGIWHERARCCRDR